MDDDTQTAAGETGAGASSSGPDDDRGSAEKTSGATATVAEEEVVEQEPHPEPAAHGFIEQDNVTVPGVQTTKDHVAGTESSHGEPLEDEGAADDDAE